MLKILHGSPGSGTPLSEQDIKDFLTTKVLNVHLGTVDENGHANIHPAWYYYDDSKEKIYVETGRHSKKMENLSRNETIYFCIDDPSPPYKGVRGKGSVEVHRDVNFNILIAQKIHLRYLGNLEHSIAHELEDAIKEGQSVILEISPKYYSTWDYSKQ
ncbi:MAG: pyridoxamine 5'-phosphate oxidase family protein [Nitrososphaeraceae archaeon]